MISFTIFKSELKVVGALVLGAAIIIGGITAWGKLHPTTTTTTPSVVPGTTITTVSTPTIEVREVDRVVSDPAQEARIKSLLAENAKYKIAVTSLTTTIGELQEKGGLGVNGGVITTELPVQPTSVGKSEEVLVSTYDFKDGQLSAKYTSDGAGFTYNLTQSFNVLTTTGKDKSGVTTSVVKLFQVGPNGSSVEVPGATTQVNATPTPVRWLVGPRIQGGFSLGPTGERGGVISLQWLRRGRSLSAEDSSLALLQPALTITQSGAKLALVLGNVNLGRIPHQPFVNIWLGGTINLDKQVGLTVSATF